MIRQDFRYVHSALVTPHHFPLRDALPYAPDARHLGSILHHRCLAQQLLEGLTTHLQLLPRGERQRLRAFSRPLLFLIAPGDEKPACEKPRKDLPEQLRTADGTHESPKAKTRGER